MNFIRNYYNKIAFIGIFLLFAGAFLIFILVTTGKPVPVDADFSLISADLREENFVLSVNTAQGTEQKLKANFSLYASDYEQVLYLSPKTAMSVNEILLIEKKEGSDLSDVTSAIKKRQEKQKANFEHYGTNQYSLLQEAILYENGRYAFYVCGEDAEAAARFLTERLEE